MRQFFSCDEAAFGELEQRAKRACIRFRNQELPPGCTPDRADVGFEVDRDRGVAWLLVNRETRYSGPSSELEDWINSGAKQFASFDDLRSWIDGPLRQAFDEQPTSDGNPEANQNPALPTGRLTDMNAVRAGIRNLKRPLFLDEAVLFDRLRQRVLGQDNVLKSLASVMARHCARQRPARPAVLFSVGPSGVGKTRTAMVTAEVLREFDPENNGYQFLRLDMTEYQEAHRVSQLIGSPQGYIGHGDGSQLLDSLRANPRTIVLFDEIEKAHPAILRVLMNAMDAGRLSTSARTSSGRDIDCRSAVFLFTSNLDAKDILDELTSRNGFGNRAVEDEVCRRRLHASGIAPEIVGRIGRFLVYQPLSPETRAEIVALAIAEVATEYGLNLAYVAPTVIIDIIRKAGSQSFGIRPERFFIDEELGGVFALAARHDGQGPVEVLGPPIVCQPLSMGRTGLDDQEKSAQTSHGDIE